MLVENEVADVSDDSDTSDNDTVVLLSDDNPVSELFAAVLHDDSDNKHTPSIVAIDFFISIWVASYNRSDYILTTTCVQVAT